ncbi:CMGC/SRPK protein kinase [Penicillium bovifimosum]|uniref:non-specific serine/threonine protein kinase n=1 Tax=Penicillium bovifimosum TaxID=126998 RepID=A0A9W9HGY8_9EURO|nr:CMGC/SRPK protein kinase [Penicillium bovifimosum]KAJ5146536.1 CMGC/SRPK protein kinase [Penicillium bovifimosum]
MSTYTSKADEMSHDTNRSSGSGPSTTGPGKTQYSFIEFIEDLDNYCPGGYHPLTIGDALNGGRYQLVDKLGYGGYSTIWLARDLRMDRYVALKAITADASSSTPEASLMHYLGNSPSTPGRGIIPPLLDEFWVTGSNGKHKCIVTPPAQMSLSDAKEASTCCLFPPKVAQSIIAQLIRGVAFLHSNDIVHGADLDFFQDLHLGNILVQFPESIDRYSTSELYEKFGEPESEAVVRLDGMPLPNGIPEHVFIPGWFGVRGNEITLGKDRIFLSDLGESFNPYKTPRSFSRTLPLLQPPEARFSDEPLSFPSDIWTLACTIFEIFGQRPLFDAFWATADRVTAEHVELLGMLPTEWWKNWDKRSEWFNEEGEVGGAARSHDTVRKTWNMRFGYSIQKPRAEAGMEVVTESESREFEAMIRSMLTFRPGDRATAQQVLHSEWMKGWGQPALEESESILHTAAKAAPAAEAPLDEDACSGRAGPEAKSGST